MRPFEIGLGCLTLAGAAILLAGFPVILPVAGAYFAILGLLLAVHLLHERAHWQLGPLYLAEAIFLLPAFLEIHQHQDHAAVEIRIVGAVIAGLLLASVLVSWAFPMFRLLEPRGPHAVGTCIRYMVDGKRDAEGGGSGRSHRELMVQLWYPAERVKGRREVYRRLAETTFKSSYQSVLRTQSLRDVPVLAEGAPYPLLIFNPAWTGQRTQSTFLMQELASRGYVVASIDHTYYSGRVAFPDGRVLDGHMAPALGDFTYLTVGEGIELANQFVTILAEDVIFVLDQLITESARESSEWYGRIDGGRVGALGHSIGGAAAAEACRLDPRIKSVLNLDGWTFGEALSHGLEKPWMVVYGKGIEVEPRDLAAQTEGTQRYWQMNRENFAIVEAALRKSGGYCLTIEGASHWNFSDRALYSPLRSRTQAGSIDARRAHRMIAEITCAFFAETLNGAAKGLVAEIAAAYREIEISR
jgi:dienelactone hydrolase